MVIGTQKKKKRGFRDTSDAETRRRKHHQLNMWLLFAQKHQCLTLPSLLYNHSTSLCTTLICRQGIISGSFLHKLHR